MRKSAFFVCESKGAKQQSGHRAADQCFCFPYIDSTILFVPKSEISSLCPSAAAGQHGLCRTWSETPKTDFSLDTTQFQLQSL